MALGETDKAENTVRLKVEPRRRHRVPDCREGQERRRPKACSRRSPATDKEGKEASNANSADSRAKVSDFGKKYQMKATGAIIK